MIILNSQEIVPSRVPGWIVPFVLVGAYGPSISAIVVTALSTGGAGVRSLLSKLLIWKAPTKVQILVCFGHPIFLAAAMLTYSAGFGSLGTPDWSRLQLIPSVLLMGIIFGPLAEELGWRGYALPLLQKKYSSLASSMIIGIAWCFWHTPLFWAPAGTLISGQEVTIIAVGKYLAFTCGFSILFTWIANKSNGSVLLPIVFHTMINASIPLLLFANIDSATSLSIKWISIIFVWIMAIGIAINMRSRDSS